MGCSSPVSWESPPQVLVWNDATRNRTMENKSHHAKAMHCNGETWTKSGSSTVPTSDVAREVVMGSVFYTPVLVNLDTAQLLIE
jgi:hypothetical protein